MRAKASVCVHLVSRGVRTGATSQTNFHIYLSFLLYHIYYSIHWNVSKSINVIQADLKCVWLTSESSKNVVYVSLNVSGISQQHQCCCSLCCLQLFVSQILSLEFIEHQVLQLVLSFWWRKRKQLVLINFWRAAARKKLPTPGRLTSAVTDSSVGIWALVVLPKNNTNKSNTKKKKILGSI